MNRIRLLPEQVANQIAAGEVVERPASVVKELVENALDAQAARILVEIQGGGRSLVRVTDEGIGMSRDDALLCLERHATSKIERAEDLAGISTMGFRGEALPSIASVSRFTLTTRERESDSPEGAQIVISGGKILEVKAAGAAPGTVVEVRQLFFNLPARRKFLRTQETETAHIQHYLTLAALAHPEVGFQFIRDGRLVWQLPPVKNADAGEALRERRRALQGDETRLLAVDFATELSPIQLRDDCGEGQTSTLQAGSLFRLWGLIGAPGVSRATREDQHLFVNRRPVENRGLNHALLEGYHTALMKGRYPVCCLFIEVDPSEVDVNIHPSKREIKFHRERVVRQLISEAIRDALVSFHSPEEAAVPPESSPGVAPPLKLEPSPAPETAPPPPPELPNFPRLSKALSNWPLPPKNEPEETRREESPAGNAPSIAPPPSQPPPAQTPAPVPAPATSTLSAPGEPVPLLRVPLRTVGVIGKLYVVLESDRGLVLLDQHAAHERILFEQMLRRLECGEAPSQRLLLPETVELSARDAQFVREQLDTLKRLGVGLSEFGERTFLLDALPPFVKGGEPRRFVVQLIDELKATGQGVNTLRLGEEMVAKTVCRHAVKANDPLSGPELEKLVEDLRHCAMPYTCPHGRPTLIEMAYRELEKKFGRTQ